MIHPAVRRIDARPSGADQHLFTVTESRHPLLLPVGHTLYIRAFSPRPHSLVVGSQATSRQRLSVHLHCCMRSTLMPGLPSGLVSRFSWYPSTLNGTRSYPLTSKNTAIAGLEPRSLSPLSRVIFTADRLCARSSAGCRSPKRPATTSPALRREPRRP